MPEPSTASEVGDVDVFSDGQIPAVETGEVARAVDRVLERRGLTGAARVRVSVPKCAEGHLLVQVNLRVRDTPVRAQAVLAGIDNLQSAIIRLDRQIVRAWGPWRPRPWPDRTRPALTAPAEAVIARYKRYVPQRITPLEAVAVMDAMDYDVHLFADAETGEDAVVYRAGPSGLRLARQRSMYPPGWSWSPAAAAPSVSLVVNSRPTPTLTEADAAARLCEHGLRFLFFTDPSSGRGQLLYPRYDATLGLITATGAPSRDGAL